MYTIIYVYLQNMDQKNIDIDAKYLPQYFHDNNTTAYDVTKNMTGEYISIYSFLFNWEKRHRLYEFSKIIKL